ncbi:hypothetical protein ACFLS4_00735 [Bacteroidota bacterium]
MKNIFLVSITIVVIIFTSCLSNNKRDVSEDLNGTHKVVVKEVLQANAYTYLNVTENETDQWIAVSKIDAKVGETYYFDDFMEMKYFESKDLARTFESVYFIQDLRSKLVRNGDDQAKVPAGHIPVEELERKPNIVKEEIKIEPVDGGITIAELYTNREKYNGKKVMIRGKIVNANFGIMNKNWFHIQDGSSTNGGFDLTITSLENEIELDDVLTFEGTVALNKDFGYGYKYEVLLEDAIIK